MLEVGKPSVVSGILYTSEVDPGIDGHTRTTAYNRLRGEIWRTYATLGREDERAPMTPVQELVAPYYFYIMAIHVLAAAIWSFSTAVAYTYYVKPALRAAARRPEDSVIRARRDEVMERFDRGASLEHVAFVVLVITALLMIWIRDVSLLRWSFIPFLFWVGVLVILPMEALDIWLSHLGGNKARLRAAGDVNAYERAMRLHMIFLRATEPLVIVLVPTLFVIAIVKPF